ncbi:MAG: ABC transporter permease [Fidelibacterota bacterium]|nr:MAG: ABC transporter permease [Candidatus Neomarinimicrobiota bacterium]
MRKILRLARREYRASVRTKGFIIGLALAPVMMSGSIIAMVLFQGKVDTADKRIAVVDRSEVVAEMLVSATEARNSAVVYDQESGKKVKPAYLIEVIPSSASDPAAQRLALSDRVRARELHAFIEIGSEVLNPGKDWEAARIRYYGENAAIDEIRGWLTGTINDYLRRLRLANTGVDEEETENVLAWINVEPVAPVSLDKDTGEISEAQSTNELETIMTPIFMLMLMFMMIMMGAIPLLNAVMEEKTLRIAEVILGSMRPFQFMMGKIIGGVAVSLTALSVYSILGIIAVYRMDVVDKIPLEVLPWIFAYMVLTIFMTGSGFAALGSACNDAKDAQNLTFPAMVPLIIPMFLLVPILQAPNSTFATGLSLFPPFTPMLMILRLSSPVGIPGWQPWVGLAEVFLLAVISVWVGGRIFRVGILMQGQPPKFSNILRWAVRG